MQTVKHFYQIRGTELLQHRGKIKTSTWLGRFATWLLSKTKYVVVVEVPKEAITYNEFRTDDAEKMIEAIFNHQACRMAFDDEIERVIVGRSHYQEIIRYELDHAMGMSVDMQFGCNGITKLVGIYVQCVPWMDGFVIVPKVKQPSPR